MAIPLETSGKEGFAPSHVSALPSLPTIRVSSSQLPLVGLQLYLLNRPHQPKAPAPSGKETLGGTGSEVGACENVLKGRKDIKGNHRIEVLIHSDTSLGEGSTGCWQTGVAGATCLEICPGLQDFGEIHSAPNLRDVFQPRVEEDCSFPRFPQASMPGERAACCSSCGLWFLEAVGRESQNCIYGDRLETRSQMSVHCGCSEECGVSSEQN